MAEGRMLKKNVSNSRRLSQLQTDSARMLWTWIIPYLDVEGRFYASPDMIKSTVVPRLKTFTEENIEAYLQDMASAGLVVLYQFDGELYLQYRKFNDFQKLRKDHEGQPLPAPNDKGALVIDLLPTNSGPTTDQLHTNYIPTTAKVKLSKVKLSKDNKGPDIEIPSWIPKEQWDGFIQMRKEIKKPLTGRAVKIAITTLLDLRNRGHDPGKVLDQSTMGKWQGLFELKSGGNGKPYIKPKEKQLYCDKCEQPCNETVDHRGMNVCQECIKILDPEIDVKIKAVLQGIGKAI